MCKTIKLIAFCMLVLIEMGSCMSMKNQNSNTTGIDPAFNVSGKTDLFLRQYSALPATTDASYPEALDALIKQHGLTKLNNGTYALCGFVRTDSLFSPTPFAEKGITFAPPIGDMRTTCVPISQLQFFFTQPHILYFEASMPVFPNN